MPQLYVYTDEFIDDAGALKEMADTLVDDRIVTKSHAQTLKLALEPLIPCNVRIGVRTPLSIIYCEAGGRRFRIGQRGQFLPGGWKANMKTKRFW